jgi:hypothetical protein
LRLRWLLRANLIPPILYKVARGEGAERGIERVLGNWERIERKKLACVPANPSLLREAPLFLPSALRSLVGNDPLSRPPAEMRYTFKPGLHFGNV